LSGRHQEAQEALDGKGDMFVEDRFNRGQGLGLSFHGFVYFLIG
jgi:hypothetical protein